MAKPNVTRKQVTLALALIFGIGVGAFGVYRLVSIKKPEVALPLIAASTSTPSPTPFAGYGLLIDKLDIKAPVPISIDVPGTDEKKYMKALESGVAQYHGTPRPGQKGNSFIFGHSSYYKNKPGDYKEVFKSIDKLVNDDIITIKHDADLINYKVFRTAIISDSDFSVLGASDKTMITLMTCWPPGTLQKRYIVQAEKVDASTPTPSTSDTPSTSPTAKTTKTN